LLAAMTSGSAVVAGDIDPGPVDPAGAVTVMFTSGTTGGRKGVRLTRANWEAAAEASMRHLGHGQDDVWLLALPLHHVAGLSILLRSAHAGGRVRLLDRFEPGSFAAHLRGGVTMASMVPTMLARLLEHDAGPYEGLRGVLLGGGPIPDLVLQRGWSAGLPLLPTYGLTETAGQVATLRPDDAPGNRARPLPGAEIRIEPDGRIAVRGAMVSPGYLGEPDRGEGEWLATGDLGSIDEEGFLRVIGRADDVIVSGGENIDPREVEAAVTGVLGVDGALVLGLPSEEWGMEAVCLYVGDAEVGEVEACVREALPGFMVPRRWLRVTGIPMTTLGKPDRAAAVRLFSRPGGRP
jgi:O-succinylbenzoic acid--CoA ligase